MKLLYLSVHSILEYDELLLFEELGIDYFSLGSYIQPNNPVDKIRPALNKTADLELLKIAPLRSNMPQEFIEHFDTIVIMHGDTPDGNWILQNWERMKHKRVIWRTIGQSTPKIEAKLKKCRDEGLQVVRYSPLEYNIEGNIGADAFIRFYKDPHEFNNWQGLGNEIITFAQNMPTRADHCNYNTFCKIVKDFNAHIYGPNNKEAGALNGGYQTYDQMKARLRQAAVYLYTGTQPASYTLSFIEALMTGIPVVALGPKFGNSLNIAGKLYEVHSIIENGFSGYWSNDVFQLQSYIKHLLRDKRHSRYISENGRKRAIELFGKDTIREQWRQFLKV